MNVHIIKPTIIKAAGNKAKMIEEFIGNVNTGTSEASVARMKSPCGWEEPPQTPEFNEYTVVLKGALHVKTENRLFIIRENESFIALKDIAVQYSTPGSEGAEYISICVPAFSPVLVHREHD